MGQIDDLANRYVAEWAPLNPTGATFVGITGYDDQLGDLSPQGYAAQAELNRRTLAELDVLEPTSVSEHTAKEAMQERLGLELARYDAGETASEINVIASGLHEIRQVFDLMPTEGPEAVANVAARLNTFAAALADYRTTLLTAADAGHVSPRAQMIEVAKQCDIWTDPKQDNFFHGLVERLGADGTLATELQRGAAAATAATAEFGQFLRTELAPRGRDKQAAGRERYQLASQYFLGARIDLDETYAWGFDELARLEAEMRAVAARILSPARPSTRPSPPSTPTRPAGSRARRRSATGCRTWPTRPSPTCTAPTSTSPSRYAGSSAASPRPATAGSTTPVPARTSPGRAGCGGRCRRGSTGSPPGAR